MLASGDRSGSPGTRGVARASGSALPLRESSLARRPRFEKKTSLRLPDCRCGAEKSCTSVSGRLERNDTGHLNARSLRDASHRTRARRTAARSEHRPLPSSSRCRPPTKQASLAPRSRRAPRTWSARPSTPRSRPATTRRVRLPRLVRVPGTEPLTLASPAPTGTGRTGMFAIPPNNYDYTEESTCEDVLARTSGRVHVVAPKRHTKRRTILDANVSFFFSDFFLCPKTPDARPPDLSCEGPAPHKQCLRGRSHPNEMHRSQHQVQAEAHRRRRRVFGLAAHVRAEHGEGGRRPRGTREPHRRRRRRSARFPRTARSGTPSRARPSVCGRSTRARPSCDC